MTHPTDTAKSEELKPCENPHLDADPRDEAVRTIFAETAIMMTHPDDERRALAKERVYSLLFARPASSPPQNDAGVEGLREAIERFIADYDDGDRADAGTNPLMQAHIADLRAALRTPMSELQALGQEFEAGEKGRRETQAVWRCAIGDACAAVDVVKNRWLTSRRKHEREAGAELSKLADLLWSVRSPAAGNYDEASIAGKRLIGLVRSNLIPSAPSGEDSDHG